MRVQRLASHLSCASPSSGLLRQGQGFRSRLSRPCASAISMSKLPQSQLQEYLKRIGNQRRPNELPPSLTILNELQFAHVTHIPFENLSLHHPTAVQKKEGISSELNKVFNNLVKQPRGGYCFEQNTLFAAVLQSLGFDLYTAAGRVVTGHDENKHENQLTGTEHMVSIVSFEDGSKWLTDVGFGSQVPRHPLRIDQLDLDPPKDSKTYGYRHRLRKGLVGSSLDISEEEWIQHQQKAGYYLQCTDSKGGWKDLYFFHLAECFEKDYAIYNWWCSAAPEAAMMNMKVAAIQTEHGRVTYDGKAFKVFKCGESGDKVAENVEAAPLGSEQTDAELQKRFGISFHDRN